MIIYEKLKAMVNNNYKDSFKMFLGLLTLQKLSSLSVTLPKTVYDALDRIEKTSKQVFGSIKLMNYTVNYKISSEQIRLVKTAIVTALGKIREALENDSIKKNRPNVFSALKVVEEHLIGLLEILEELEKTA